MLHHGLDKTAWNTTRLLVIMTLLWLALGFAKPAQTADMPDDAALTSTPFSAGWLHRCAIKSDGTLTCWGNNGYGQLNAPAVPFAQVSAGWLHTCAIKRDGTLACWGDNRSGLLNHPTGTFTQIGAGTSHTCALKPDGTLTCWGSDSYGQLNAPAGAFTQLSTKADHTCAIKSDDTLACWGNNSSGQSSAPAGAFIQVGAGAYHTCAIKSDDTLTCWGDNGFGQLNAPAGTFTQLTAGAAHTCALKSDGTLACWGDNGSGQCNAPAGTFTQVNAGWQHTCAIRSDGSLTCWGFNNNGQAPRLSLTPASQPGGAVGVAYSQTLLASGGTAPYTHKLVAGSLPPGLSLSAGGVISGTPAAGGIFHFTIQASDSWGVIPLSVQASYALTINTAPVLAEIGNKTVKEGETLSFTALAADSDLPANTLTYSLDPGAPEEASIDPATGAFHWTPTPHTKLGIYTVTIRVTDDGTPALDDSETIQVTVKALWYQNWMPLIIQATNP